MYDVEDSYSLSEENFMSCDQAVINYSFEQTTAASSEQIYSLLDLRFVRIDSKSCYCFIFRRKK